MGSISTAVFHKSKTCPSAESLLRYRRDPLNNETYSEVSAHLQECDFCGAELQLLTKYPPASAPRYQVSRIPPPLYRLAMDLLALPPRTYDGTITRRYEIGSLTLTDA